MARGIEGTLVSSEVIDFNNGTLPDGWRLDWWGPGQNGGVINGRLEANPVDTYVAVSRAVVSPANATALRVTWTANLANAYWGMGSSVRLDLANGDRLSTGVLKAGWGNYWIEMYGTLESNWVKDPLTLTPGFGTYVFTAEFSAYTIRLTAVNIATNDVFFDRDYAVAGFTLDQAKRLIMFECTTTDAGAWLDDVQIEWYCAAAPTIIRQPQGGAIRGAQTILLDVSAGGQDPLSYQWFNGTAGDTTHPIDGASSSAMNTNIAGDYWVRVSNAYGFADSNVATVERIPVPPTITLQPANAEVNPGNTVWLFVHAEGDPTLEYQWFQGESGDTSVPVPNATDRIFFAPDVAAAYWVRVSNYAGTADSAAATVSVVQVETVTVTRVVPCFRSCTVQSDFGSVASPGELKATFTSPYHPAWPQPLPSGYVPAGDLVRFEWTGPGTPSARVTFVYPVADFRTGMRIFQYIDGRWIDVTEFLDPANHLIRTRVTYQTIFLPCFPTLDIAITAPDAGASFRARTTFDLIGEVNSPAAGAIYDYEWRLSKAGSADMVWPGSSTSWAISTPISIADPGTYKIRLTVSDRSGNTATTNFVGPDFKEAYVVILTRHIPTANAGNNVSILAVNQGTTLIKGLGTDIDGDPLTYRWSEGDTVLAAGQVGPAGEAWLDLAKLPKLTLGEHTLTLVISNGLDESLPSAMTLTMRNSPPMVRAGNNRYMLSNQQANTVVTGTASDADGDSLTFEWREGVTVLAFGAVPVSGQIPLQLGQLPKIAIGAHELTLAVSDGHDTAASSMLLTVENSPPTAAPLGDGTCEFGQPVSLWGQVSDYDGDTLSYTWLEGSTVLGTGVIATASGGAPATMPKLTLKPMGLGDHIITLAVSDGINAPVTANLVVTVIDTTAPIIVPEASQTIIWPPNHKMVPITIRANATDAGNRPVALSASISCNESEPGQAFWTTPVIDQQTGVISVSLLAERWGNGGGRFYTISLTATDQAGNRSSANVVIVVPHDRGKN